MSKKILQKNNIPVRRQSKNLAFKNTLAKKPFAQVLDNIVKKDVKFSKHAMERLDSRRIKLNSQEMTKIKEALNKAQKKGIKETLILMDNKAFVASVENKTIITVALEEQLKENIFTNIDGAVIL